MQKLRVYQLAKELGVTSKELIEKLETLHITVANHMSTVTEGEAKVIGQLVSNKNQTNQPPSKGQENQNRKTDKETATKKENTASPNSGVQTPSTPQKSAQAQNPPRSQGAGQSPSSNRPQGASQSQSSNRPQGAGQSQSSNRPQGAGQSSNRPQGAGQSQSSNRPQGSSQGQSSNRPQGASQSQSSNRPQGSGQGQSSNRPQGSSQGQSSNRPQGSGQGQSSSRPQGSGQSQSSSRPQGSGQGQSSSRPQGSGQSQSSNRPQGSGQSQSSNRPQGSGASSRPAARSNQGPPAQGGSGSSQNRGASRPGAKPGAGGLRDMSKPSPGKRPGRPGDRKGKDNRRDGKKMESTRITTPKPKPIDLANPLHAKKNRDKNAKTLVIDNPAIVQIIPGASETEASRYVIPESIKVGDLAEVLSVAASEIIMKLIKLGIMANINQEIKFETAEKIAKEYQIDLELRAPEEQAADILIQEDEAEDLTSRSPIVTVMGHVDHGKTSLLDAIRNTRVTDREAGGITQHIGAYEVNVQDQRITFLDTPGHEAFTEMRSRGAQVTDIAILVVAADDGIMPQTVEAINHAQAAKVPIIVAINKIDKPAANVERVRQELSEKGLLVEAWGGDVIDVPVSAKTGENIDQLLEMVLLVSEVEELKANPNRLAIGTVIEANLDKGRGPVATVIVTNGTLKISDSIVAGTTYGKVRAMLSDSGKRIKKAGPSTPVEILGLNEVPNAGDQFIVLENDKEAKSLAENRKQRQREEYMRSSSKMNLEDIFDKMQQDDMKEFNVIIKADVQGSAEALSQSLSKLSNEEVSLRVIHAGVGAITESDVMLASASEAVIIGFNVRPSTGALGLIERENVDLRGYRVIYEAIEDMEKAMKGMLAPEYVEQALGRAEVRATFKVPGIGIIAGSYVLSGKIIRNAKLRLLRDNVIIHEGDILSLRRFKDDVKEVAAGYECGIGLSENNDIKEGDVIEAYIMKEVARK